jgi:isopenicillin-N N-acyltransferase like protein
LTTVGCLSLIGMNEHGIAVGTTNLRTTDARAGVMYLSIIHKALSSPTRQGAVSAITGAERAGAHYYYVCDRSGSAVAIECTAHHAHRREVQSGIAVHCNHCLTEECARVEGAQPSESSRARQARIETWLGERSGDIDEGILKQALGDRSGGALSVCRFDPMGISTNGAVVMSPESGAIEACQGQPPEESGTTGRWVDLGAVPRWCSESNMP